MTDKLKLYAINLEVLTKDGDTKWVHFAEIGTSLTRPLFDILEELRGDDWCYQTIHLMYDCEWRSILLEYDNGGTLMEVCEEDDDCCYGKVDSKQAVTELDLDTTLSELLYLDDNWKFEN